MKGNIVETIIGAIVLAVAVGFILFAYKVAGSSSSSGYEISANFDRVDGLAMGADVRMSGIKIGSVSGMELNENFEAAVKMTINPDVKLYDGTAAKITSAGLLGNQYVSLDPGGGLDVLGEGGVIAFTTGSVDLFALISKFIFSGDSDSAEDKSKSNGN